MITARSRLTRPTRRVSGPFKCLPLYDGLLDSAYLWQMQITELITSLPSPQLAIARSGTNVMVSWPAPASGYQLLSATNLASPVAWSNVSQTPVTNGNVISVPGADFRAPAILSPVSSLTACRAPNRFWNKDFNQAFAILHAWAAGPLPNLSSS